MLFLPECFGFIGSSAQQTLENAEDIASLSSTDLDSLLGNDTRNEWIHNLQDVVINEMNNKFPIIKDENRINKKIILMEWVLELQ